jgi:hypothetical protein
MLGAIHSRLRRDEDRLELAVFAVTILTLLGMVLARQFVFTFKATVLDPLG